MTAELPPEPPLPSPAERQIHDSAARAFEHAAAAAKAPLGRARSVWTRRIEPWLVAAAALGLVAWAIVRVFF